MSRRLVFPHKPAAHRPERQFDGFRRTGRGEHEKTANFRIWMFVGIDIRAPDKRDGIRLTLGAVKIKRNLGIGGWNGRRLAQEIEMGRQQDGRIRFPGEGVGVHPDGKGVHPEVHNTVSALFLYNFLIR